MRPMKPILLSCLSLLSLAVASVLTASPLYAADAHPLQIKLDDLRYSQQQLAARNPEFLGAYEKLIAGADKALGKPLYSVMDKTLTAASGDKHDYYSFPPYWWPDPNKKDGLPYIRKDGQTNPDANSDATDKKRLVNMSNDVWTLSLAWQFTQKPAYAEKARDQLLNWFVNPVTRMNPNLQHAQAIPGINDGRGIGLIDSRALVEVIDAVELLRPANVISDDEYQKIKQWYGDFYHWMTTSQNGFEEDNWHNNHGTYFDLQAASFALFSGDLAAAKKRLQITQLRRIPVHFDRDGRQMAEIERTRPWHYSNFHLEAYNKLGRLGEIAQVDVWNFTLDDRSLRKGYAYVANYVHSNEPWPWKDIDKMDDEKALVNMVSAARAWPDDSAFAEKAQWLMAKYPDDISHLITPLKQH